ncbi:MAG: universal stress protein [Rectinemataceae bacterium]
MKKPLSSLVVAINGSDSSISAFKYAVALGRELPLRIIAAYVVDTATIRQLALSRIFVPDEGDEYERSLEESGRRYLSFCADLAAAKRIRVETQLRRGSVAGEIIRTAEETNSDCIVLGGWSGNSASRDVLLEANREILKSAHCSVLIVKGPEAEAAYRAL